MIHEVALNMFTDNGNTLTETGLNTRQKQQQQKTCQIQPAFECFIIKKKGYIK